MIKKDILSTVLWLGLAVAAVELTGCSVFMATRQPDKKDLSVLEVGNPRSFVLSELGQPISTEIKNGKRVDIFKFIQGYGKATKTGRALFHGTADVVTLGLWEVVATPTEVILDGKKMAYEVIYDANDRVEKVIPLFKTRKPGTGGAAQKQVAVKTGSIPQKQRIKSPSGAQKYSTTLQIQTSAQSAVQHWAVIVGISKYAFSGSNGLTDLIFADDDARTFARVLMRLGWSQSHIKLLVNEGATKRNITIALESWLTKAGPNDRLVLYWAGHAFPDPEDPEKIYFVCYDTELSIPATGYRMDRVRDALEEQKTKNVLMFADTCHAGKLITRGERAIGLLPSIDKMAREKNIPKGWIFMVGADADRKAIEHSSWTNGAFTHSLIKGLDGAADGYQSVGPKDNIITMGELRAYMNTSMPEETHRVLGVAKRPVITTSTGDPDIWNLTLQVK
jgi:hypothetical protein